MKASREGRLAPAQCALRSPLNVLDLERGQATLPNLHSNRVERLPGSSTPTLRYLELSTAQ